MREQLWIVPSGDGATGMRATVFRPAEDVPVPRIASGSAPDRKRPLVIINHGTSEATRLAVSLPVYYWMSRWFVERGYVVLLPQRPGHGATGGDFAEGRDSCADPDHASAGQGAARDIAAAATYMSRQNFVAATGMIVVGISSGGWASLALAARNAPEVGAVVNFSGGRGAYARGRANTVCAPDRLVAAAGAFGRAARVRTLWLYADNDSYFGPELARAMAGAWSAAGGHADLRVLPAYRDEGHDLANDLDGWHLWGPAADAFLRTLEGTAIAQTSENVQHPPAWRRP